MDILIPPQSHYFILLYYFHDRISIDFELFGIFIRGNLRLIFFPSRVVLNYITSYLHGKAHSLKGL